MTAAWHVAVTWPGRELSALTNLTSPTLAPFPNPSWAETKYPAIFPRWHEQRKSHGKMIEFTRPLASGYVLVHFKNNDPVTWHDVRDRCGVGTRFIGGELPYPVSDTQVALLLRDALTEDGLLPTPADAVLDLDLAIGDHVHLLQDAWLGYSGKVIWFDEKGARIQTTLFGRLVPGWWPHGTFEKRDPKAFQAQQQAPQYGRLYA